MRRKFEITEDRWLNLVSHLSLLERRIDRLVEATTDLKGNIQGNQNMVSELIPKLVDRITQMSMVKSGDSEAAWKHLRASNFNLDQITSPAPPEEDPDEWPPPGLDTLDMMR